MRLASIHVYPLKGARGISRDASDVLRSGLRHDRRFMLVDADGIFMTQRRHPNLALVDVAFGDHDRAITIGGEVSVSLDDDAYRSAPRRDVKVWSDTVDAVEVEGDASAFLSDRLGARCTLLYIPDHVVRPVEAPHGREGDRVGFADAYPILVASLASLADLNARIACVDGTPVPMDRFRPNLVVEGGAPWDEERFPEMRVGDVRLRLPKKCSRCEVTLVNQATAEVGKEPLRTLASYRKDGNYVYFAMNAIPDCEGRVTVNDAVGYA